MGKGSKRRPENYKAFMESYDRIFTPENEVSMKTWQERADACLAQGCTTYSKRHDQFIGGVYATHAKEGRGAHIVTMDGKTLIDHTCGLGSNIINCRNNFGLPCIEEVMLAESLKDRMKFIDKIKLLKTGSEACQAAVRIARAYHQNKKAKEFKLESIKIKDLSICGCGTGYHGWHNWVIAAEDPGMGTCYEGYLKLKDLDEVIHTITNGQSSMISYVIIEPVMLDLNVKHQLKKIREICTEKDITLIFDEVITGFRTPQYCFANYYGVQPDLICLGKALANGHPIGVVGGRAKYMDTPGYFVSSTFAGEQATLCSALMTLDYLTEERLQKLWTLGEWFQAEFNKISPRVQLYGLPTRAVWRGTEHDKGIFMQEMYRSGVLYGKAWWITCSHTKDLLQTELDIAISVWERIGNGEVKLEGTLPTEIFKRY